MTQTTEHQRAEFDAWLPNAYRQPQEVYTVHNMEVAFIAGMQAARRSQTVPQGWKLVPVGWQFYEDGKWWNGDDRIKDHRKNTEEAGVRVRDVYAIHQPKLLTVDVLVEALEQVIKAAPGRGPLWHGSEQIVAARIALDAYRKQGGGQ